MLASRLPQSVTASAAAKTPHRLLLNACPALDKTAVSLLDEDLRKYLLQPTWSSLQKSTPSLKERLQLHASLGDSCRCARRLESTALELGRACVCNSRLPACNRTQQASFQAPAASLVPLRPRLIASNSDACSLFQVPGPVPWGPPHGCHHSLVQRATPVPRLCPRSRRTGNCNSCSNPSSKRTLCWVCCCRCAARLPAKKLLVKAVPCGLLLQPQTGCSCDTYALRPCPCAPTTGGARRAALTRCG